MSNERDGLDADSVDDLETADDHVSPQDEPTAVSGSDAESVDTADGAVTAGSHRLDRDSLDADSADSEPAEELDASDDDAERDDSVHADAEMATAVAGSSRAAARRSPAATSTTAKKGEATRKRDESDTPGVVSRLSRFVREVVAELRKVIWPGRKQWLTFTLVVIVFLAVMVALVSGLDVLFHLIVGKVFG